MNGLSLRGAAECRLGVFAKSQPVTLAASLILLLVFLFAGAIPASAAPRVLLDGQPLSFDVPPTIGQGRVLVPMRAIFQALGAELEWDGATRTVTATRGQTTVS